MKTTLIDRRTAHTVAQEIKIKLEPFVERIEIVGSLRRDRPRVHDIELLFIPRLVPEQKDLAGAVTDWLDTADHFLTLSLKGGLLTKRLGEDKKECWGPKNKLAVHLPSGIPVDFFSTTTENWWNSLVVRTGGKKMNLQITTTAQRNGWSFEAYGSGFRKLGSPVHRQMFSEEEIFKFVGLPYLEPCLRP